jgi:ribosome-associated translation inhibitor RaiA
MILTVQITFRNMPPSDAVAARVQEEAEKLDEFYRRITSCRVIVEIPHRHHTMGEQFHIRIELGVPGDEIVVRHEPSLRSAVRRAMKKSNGVSWIGGSPRKPRRPRAGRERYDTAKARIVYRL